MGKYIDADLYVEMQIYDDEHEEWGEWKGTIEDLLNQWTEQGCPPTIEIVRCKDCKFCEKHEDYSPTPIEPPWCYCKNPWVMRETGFNDFCSYGERIESEENDEE